MPFKLSSFKSFLGEARQFLSQCIGFEAPRGVTTAEAVAAANARWNSHIDTPPVKPFAVEGKHVHSSSNGDAGAIALHHGSDQLDELVDFLNAFVDDPAGRLRTSSEANLQKALAEVSESIPAKFWFEENGDVAYLLPGITLKITHEQSADLAHL